MENGIFLGLIMIIENAYVSIMLTPSIVLTIESKVVMV